MSAAIQERFIETNDRNTVKRLFETLIDTNYNYDETFDPTVDCQFSSEKFDQQTVDIEGQLQKYHPRSRRIIIYYIFLLSLIVWEMFYRPVVIAFSTDDFHWFSMTSYWVSELVYIFDIYVSFNSGYMTSTGIVKMNKVNSRKSYIKKYLTYDIISIIPVVFILYLFVPDSMKVNSILAPNLLRLFGFSHLIKIGKLFYVFRITRYLYSIDFNYSLIHHTVLKILKLFLYLAMLCHVSCCVFFSISAYTFSKGAKNSFIEKTEITNATNIQCYTHSLYFTVMVMTTVGFGDISGQNEYERTISIIFEVFGTLMYCYGTTSIIILFRILYNEEFEYLYYFSKIDLFMRYKNYPQKLRDMIQKYYCELYTSQKLLLRTNALELFQHSSPQIKYEIIKYENPITINSLPFLSSLPSQIITAFILKLKNRYASPEETIQLNYSEYNKFYLLHSGRMKFLSPNENNLIIRSYDGFTMFGAFFLLHPTTYNITLISESFCHYRTLSYNDYNTFLQSYPEYATEIKQYFMDNAENENYIFDRHMTVNNYNVQKPTLFPISNLQPSFETRSSDAHVTRSNQISKPPGLEDQQFRYPSADFTDSFIFDNKVMLDNIDNKLNRILDHLNLHVDDKSF